jgi:drug/metabolite transporter (DMT)-like permease
MTHSRRMTNDGMINRSSGVDAVSIQLSRAEVVERPGLAIGMFLLAMIVFTIMDGFSKYVTNGGLAPEVVTMLRYTIAMAILLPVVILRWETRPLYTTQPLLHALRGLLLIGSATIFVYALQSLPLETATSIGFVSPMFVTIFSIIFLSEKVGIRRWAAIVVGFSGVVAILRPGTDAFSPAMLLPILSSCCWAGGLIITRKMRGREKPFTVLIWTTVIGLLFVTPLGISSWHMPTLEQWIALLAIACCHMTGQILTIRAFMLGSASMLAPFSYTTIIWATLIGFFAFGSLPDFYTGVGTTILAAAGLYVWHRERIRQTVLTTPGASISAIKSKLHDVQK